MFTKSEVHAGVRLWPVRDEIEGNTFLYHWHDKFKLKQAGIFPYIGQKDDGGHAWMRLRLRTGYAAREMQRLESVLVNVDSNRYKFSNGNSQCVTQLTRPADREVLEVGWNLDSPVDDEATKFLHGFDGAVTCNMRFYGQRFNVDIHVPGWNIRLVSDVLRAFESLKATD
jgi:hypothetical protein